VTVVDAAAAIVLSISQAARGRDMAQVLVRNLDDGVVQRLKTKAELKGRSLEQELREVLTRAAGLSPEEKVAVSDRIRAMQPKPLETDSADLIREGRDRGWT
jgi:antitoxin FitA